MRGLWRVLTSPSLRGQDPWTQEEEVDFGLLLSDFATHGVDILEERDIAFDEVYCCGLVDGT